MALIILLRVFIVYWDFIFAPVIRFLGFLLFVPLITLSRQTSDSLAPKHAGAAMVNMPTAGKIIVAKTSDGRYAKMEILSYYKDAPATPTFNNEARYYTFRYVYQPNDTRSFE